MYHNSNEDKISGPDRDCVEKLRNGNPEIWRAFVGHQQTACRAYMWHKVGNTDDFEDVFQQSVMEFYGILKSGVEIRNSGGLCYDIFKKRLINHLARKRHKQIDHSLQNQSVLDVEEIVLDQLDREAYMKWAEECIEEQLTPQLREIVLAYFFQEKDVQEIANHLGKSEGTVWTNLTRARNRLLDCVKKKAGKM